MENLEIWKFLAGLGLFMFAMNHLESSLKALAGRRFKLFLQKYTHNRILAVLNGVLTTAVLQSSSLVMLLVLAFSGAGIISLSNSLGIILGANLGTTFTGWIVSYFGFGAGFDALALPFLAIGGVAITVLPQRFRFYHVFSFLTAFALLLLGLSFMKQGFSGVTEWVDFSILVEFGAPGFFVTGFLITALIQSSSAMMAITLSALHLGVIDLPSAAYVAIGADLGTTMTALIASLPGGSIKRRVGFAHFMFNVASGMMAILLLHPLLYLIQEVIHIGNPLFSLVAFHSSFNLVGILVFLPFLRQFETLLNRFFVKETSIACLSFSNVSPEVPEAALEAVRQEALVLANRVLNFIFIHLYPHNEVASHRAGEISTSNFLNMLLEEEDIGSSYELLKSSEAEILHYTSQITMQPLGQDDVTSLNKYVLQVRNFVHAAKSLKDIHHNLVDLKESADPIDEMILHRLTKDYGRIHAQLAAAVKRKVRVSEPDSLLSQLRDIYQSINHDLYNERANREAKLPSLLNVNRQIFESYSLLAESL